MVEIYFITVGQFLLEATSQLLRVSLHSSRCSCDDDSIREEELGGTCRLLDAHICCQSVRAVGGEKKKPKHMNLSLFWLSRTYFGRDLMPHEVWHSQNHSGNPCDMMTQQLVFTVDVLTCASSLYRWRSWHDPLRCFYDISVNPLHRHPGDPHRPREKKRNPRPG